MNWSLLMSLLHNLFHELHKQQYCQVVKLVRRFKIIIWKMNVVLPFFLFLFLRKWAELNGAVCVTLSTGISDVECRMEGCKSWVGCWLGYSRTHVYPRIHATSRFPVSFFKFFPVFFFFLEYALSMVSINKVRTLKWLNIKKKHNWKFMYFPKFNETGKRFS